MNELYHMCTLCPRACKVDRAAGQTGFCGAGVLPVVARAALHHWEEPCISGARGSGAVFFAHCTLACVYCQNASISRGGKGIEVTPRRLAEIFLSLQQQGAHNINLVTPTHYLPSIMEALDQAKDQGLALPVIYNCGGYETVETVRLLKDYVNVWLPDWKYFDKNRAARYSAAPDYLARVEKAICQMARQAGSPQFDAEGILQRGVMIRHLLLPGGLGDAKRILSWIRKELKNRVLVSLMSQFTPTKELKRYPEINRTIRPIEYKALLAFGEKLGIERGYTQELSASGAEYIPAFDGEGVV